MKIFPLMRSRLKDRESRVRVKSLFRRASSLGDLAHPRASPSDLWCSGSERPEREGSEGEEDGKETPISSSLASSTLSIIHPHHHHSTAMPSCHLSTAADAPAVAAECPGLWVAADKDSSDSAVPSGPEDSDEPQHHGVNGAVSGAQSESSGEFSLSLDNEPWSAGSSPVRRPPSLRSSSACRPPPSDASTPRPTRPPPPAPTMCEEEGEPAPEKRSPPTPVVTHAQDEVGNKGAWPCRRSVIRRGAAAGGKGIRRPSDTTAATVATQGPPGASETTMAAAATQSTGCSPIAVLYVQGKSTSVSGCLNCFSSPVGKEERARGQLSPPTTLPRASSVISTAEGSLRRPSANIPPPVNGIQEVEDSANHNGREDTGGGGNEPVPPAKPPRDPAATAAGSCLRSSCEGSLFGTPFNFSSVFSDTIFSGSVVAGHGENGKKNQNFLCLNPSLVRNISCPPLRQEPISGTALTEGLVETDQNQNQNGQHVSGEESKGTRVCEDVSAGIFDDKQFVIA